MQSYYPIYFLSNPDNLLPYRKFLYPSSDGEDSIIHHRPGQYEVFAKVDSLIRSGISQLILNDSSDHTSTKSDSLLGGAMARALCYIHR